MRLVIHQALKDARLVRWYVAAWLLVLVAYHGLFLVVAGQSSADPLAINRMESARTALAVIGTAAFIILAALLVQNDSPVSTSAFWLTRPLPAATVLGSKLLLAFLVLIVLPLAGDALDYIALGLPLRIFPLESPAFQLAWLLPIMAVAAITVGLPRFFLIALFEVVLFVGVASVLFTFDVGRNFFAQQLWATYLTTGAVGGVLLVFMYATRRMKAGVVLFGLAPLALAGYTVFWPWSRPAPQPYPEAKRSRLSVTIDPSSLAIFERAGSRVIRAPLTFGGLEPGMQPYIIPWRDYTRRAWLDVNGEKIPVDLQVASPPKPTPDETRERAQRLLAPSIGSARLLNPDAINAWAPTLGIPVAVSDFDRIANQPATLHVEVQVSIYGYKTESRMRPVAGASFDALETHGRIVNTSTGRAIHLDMKEASRQVLYYANWSSLFYVLRNTLRGPDGQAVIGSHRLHAQFGGIGRASLPRQLLPLPQTPAMLWETLDFGLVPGFGSFPPFPDARQWLKDAELLVISSSPAGDIRVSIDVPNLRLATIPVAPGSF